MVVDEDDELNGDDDDAVLVLLDEAVLELLKADDNCEPSAVEGLDASRWMSKTRMIWRDDEEGRALKVAEP